MIKTKENKKTSQLPGIFVARQMADVRLAPGKLVTITVSTSDTAAMGR